MIKSQKMKEGLQEKLAAAKQKMSKKSTVNKEASIEMIENEDTNNETSNDASTSQASP